MFDEKIYSYLDSEDKAQFKEYWGPETQYLLVSGRKTNYRLEKYLPDDHFRVISVIITALVRDFELPAVRYTNAIALMIFLATFRDRNHDAIIRKIAIAELALLLEHLDTDSDDGELSEKDLFERDSKKISERWDEYIQSPEEFVL